MEGKKIANLTPQIFKKESKEDNNKIEHLDSFLLKFEKDI